MSFDDLTPALAAHYAREQGFFAPGTALCVHEIDNLEGEGFVNHLYRVSGNSRAVIIKQAKPYLSFWGPAEYVPLTVSRSAIEANSYLLRAPITGEHQLPVLLVDPENNLFVQECWQRPTVRSWWKRGIELPRFPVQIGSYIARNSFFTSAAYVGPDAHRQLDAAFTNSPMRSLMEGILFDFDNLHPVADAFEKITDFRPVVLSDPELRGQLEALRDIYNGRAECLVHGDLHTSNIMYEGERMIVFDMEYTHMGAFSTDLGYLLGGFISPYLAVPYRHDLPLDARRSFGRRVLASMTTVVDTYLRVFSSLFAAYAQPGYRDQPGYLDQLFADLVPNVIGLAGTQLLSRVMVPGADQDYEPIHDPQAHEELRHLTVAVGIALLKAHRTLPTMRDATSLIESVATAFHTAKRPTLAA
ncbi:MAG: phosphotransferase [Propionibacteriaceae bacterium]|nr:phosphotransferase [Propionibacteriaceae bacterium]